MQEIVRIKTGIQGRQAEKDGEKRGISAKIEVDMDSLQSLSRVLKGDHSAL